MSKELDLQRFATIASHDLQAPIRYISSFTELLQATYGDKLDPRAQDWLKRISHAASHLQMLVNDLLEFSLIDSQVRAFRTVPLQEILARATAALDEAISETSAIITADGLPDVWGEPSQLLQLFTNLLDNAIKYRSPAPPQIHVSALRSGSQWTVSVKDNGIGIDEKHHPTIFDMFSRLHSLAEYPGTGVGLAICRRIVERHGGRIWLESEPNHGTTFSFTIETSDQGQ